MAVWYEYGALGEKEAAVAHGWKVCAMVDMIGAGPTRFTRLLLD